MPCGFILFFPFSYNAISFLSPRRCVGERVGGWPVLEHNPLQTDGRKMTSKFAHEVGYVCVCAMHSSTCAEKKKCNHRFPSEGDLKRKKKSNHAAHSDTKMSPYLKQAFPSAAQSGSQTRASPLPTPAHPVEHSPHPGETASWDGSRVCWDGSRWCSFQRKEEEQQDREPFSLADAAEPPTGAILCPVCSRLPQRQP